MQDAWSLFGPMNGDVDRPVLGGVSEVLLNLVDPVGCCAIGGGWMGASGTEDPRVVPWLKFEMANDDLHVRVADAHQPCVPSDPELVTDVFGWDLVV